MRRIFLHSMAVVVLCSGSGFGPGHPRDQFKLFCDKRPQITSTLIAPLFSLSGARIYISKNWLTSSFKGSFFNWASLREPLVSSLALFSFCHWSGGCQSPQKISCIFRQNTINTDHSIYLILLKTRSNWKRQSMEKCALMCFLEPNCKSNRCLKWSFVIRPSDAKIDLLAKMLPEKSKHCSICSGSKLSQLKQKRKTNNSSGRRKIQNKHCQRHYGPRRWLL